MEWHILFPANNQPTYENIEDYIGTGKELWKSLVDFMETSFKVKPKLSYSNCAMDKGAWKGWNIKFTKSGKSLCTVYPKQGYFLALITVSEKDAAEADLLMPLCTDYVKNLYDSAEFGKNYGKMLGIEVTSEVILRDLKELAALRGKKKPKA